MDPSTFDAPSVVQPLKVRTAKVDYIYTVNKGVKAFHIPFGSQLSVSIRDHHQQIPCSVQLELASMGEKRVHANRNHESVNFAAPWRLVVVVDIMTFSLTIFVLHPKGSRKSFDCHDAPRS
jgi:hypothetical protein